MLTIFSSVYHHLHFLKPFVFKAHLGRFYLRKIRQPRRRVLHLGDFNNLMIRTRKKKTVLSRCSDEFIRKYYCNLWFSHHLAPLCTTLLNMVLYLEDLLDVVQAAGVWFEGGRVANHLVKSDHQEHQVQLEVKQRSEVIKNIQVIPRLRCCLCSTETPVTNT